MQHQHRAAGALAQVDYFAGLDAPVFEAICRASVRRAYIADEVVFIEGEPCASLHVVESGWLKSVRSSPAGREQVLRVVGPGEMFNEVGVLTGSVNPATVIALEPAVVWVIARAALLELMDQHCQLSHIIIANLAQRVQHLLDLVEDLSLRSVEERLARLLLQDATAGVLPRRPWTTQAELASRLGTVSDVLQRTLRGLADAGVIRVERRAIHILDPERLASIAKRDS